LTISGVVTGLWTVNVTGNELRFDMKDDYPYLELEFAEDDAKRFLIEASFRLEEEKAVSHSLITDPPGNKLLRALCILMLLTKHRGESFMDAEGKISFKAVLSKPTWIKTLGENFGQSVRTDLCDTHFGSQEFLSAKRGTGHNSKDKKDEIAAGPSVTFDTKKMPLKNLSFYKRSRRSPEKPRIPMTESDLALFAEKLELFEVKKLEATRPGQKPRGWEESVPEIVAKTNQDRPQKSQQIAKRTSVEHGQEETPFVLSARWQELFSQILKEKEREKSASDWYVVSLVPAWMLDWKNVFFNSVEQHGSKVRIIYHSPTAAKNSAAVKAQWRMNSSRVDPNYMDVVDYVSKRLLKRKKEMSEWGSEIKKNSTPNSSSKGSFEFFESYIVHPFMGIMAVPSGTKRSSTLTAVAPPGTWCLLSLYPFYQVNFNHRCGLYLNGPSPVLDIYYNSILDLFEQGPKAGYLKAVDLFSKSPKQK
jgi:hypothetical protein